MIKLRLLALCVLCLLPTSAKANEDPAWLSISLGYFGFIDEGDALDFRAEYRFSENLSLGIKPFAGIELTSDASLWVGGGVYKDFNIAENLFLTPSFGVGYYAQGSSNLDLSKTFQARSQIEIGYQLNDFSRASLAISHISNASTDEKNPGTEILSIYYHVPF